MPVALTIHTPDRTLLEAEPCHEIELTATDGTLGVLEGHTPLVTPLGIGELRVFTPEGSVTRRIALSGGFAEVNAEAVIVTARAAEAADEIDVPRARAAHDRAHQRLRQRTEDIDVARAEAALARAANRLHIAEMPAH